MLPSVFQTGYIVTKYNLIKLLRAAFLNKCLLVNFFLNMVYNVEEKWNDYGKISHFWFWSLERTFCFYDLSLSLSLYVFKIQLCSTLHQRYSSFIWGRLRSLFIFLDTYKSWIIAKINDLGQVINGNALLVDWVQLGFCYHNSSCSCAFK